MDPELATAPTRSASTSARHFAVSPTLNDTVNFTSAGYWERFTLPGAYDLSTTLSYDAFGNPLDSLRAQTWALIPPTPWHPTDFDVAIHSRDQSTWYTPEGFMAMHGTNCVPFQKADPLTDVRSDGSHAVASYDDMNYRCRNHMMTAIKASGYGVIYVTPNVMVDISKGEASVKFALATLRTSGRDWIDLWITPWDENLKIPLDASLSATDMQGPPRHAVHVRMIPELAGYTKSAFEAYLINDFVEYKLPVASSAGYESILTPISTRRDTFELKISKTHLSFGMFKPASPGDSTARSLTWIDTPIPELPITRGVIQFGHHSFNPDLARNPALPVGTGGTWHWDEFKIAPAVPFTIITPVAGARRYADQDSSSVTLASPTPAGSYLRFAAYGGGLQVSLDGGKWIKAVQQDEKFNFPDRFHSYWMPIPAGVKSVSFRNVGGFNVGTWIVRDVAVWSEGGTQSTTGSSAGLGKNGETAGN